MSDEDILYQYCITSPETMIRVARLSLWTRILCKAPALVVNLCMDMATINVGWPKVVLSDLRWMSGSVKYATFSSTPFEDWPAEIKGNSKYFKGQIKKYSRLRFANTYSPPHWERAAQFFRAAHHLCLQSY